MLEFEQYCSQLVAETEQLAAGVEDADLTVGVPSCPGWDVGQLLRHLGGGQRWAAAAVGGRIQAPLPEDSFTFRDLSAFAEEDPAVVGPWLAEGAGRLADSLRTAGPG